jgi:hypothetical protein
LSIAIPQPFTSWSARNACFTTGSGEWSIYRKIGNCRAKILSICAIASEAASCITIDIGWKRQSECRHRAKFCYAGRYMARVEKNQLLSGALAVARRPFTQLLLLLSVLAWCDAYGGAAGEATSGRDRAIVAQLNQRPLIFFVAKGGPDACGSGCSKWIAADGMIDSGARAMQS